MEWNECCGNDWLGEEMQFMLRIFLEFEYTIIEEVNIPRAMLSFIDLYPLLLPSIISQALPFLLKKTCGFSRRPNCYTKKSSFHTNQSSFEVYNRILNILLFTGTWD